MNNTSPFITQVLQEQHQSHEMRKHLIKNIEEKYDRPVLSFFTSFTYPVMIEDGDANMIEGMLSKMNLAKGLLLIISSPGGDGLASERIINICRNYSGTGEFWAMVPNKAKSAATMICFGASKIIMSPTSELGPIDPQLAVTENDVTKRYSICNIIDSYNDLFQRAVNTNGNLEPFLQQLENFDEREIKEFEKQKELSVDIAIRALKEGMLSEFDTDTIKEKIKIFLTPDEKKVHGRSIFINEAEKCGLKIEKLDLNNDNWKLINELFIRTNYFVDVKVAKCVETKDESFQAGR